MLFLANANIGVPVAIYSSYSILPFSKSKDNKRPSPANIVLPSQKQN